MADLLKVPHGGLRCTTGAPSDGIERAFETLYLLITRSEFEMTKATPDFGSY
jgi:hypothetical protein